MLPNVVVWALSLVTFPDPDGLTAAAKLTAMARTPVTPMLVWYVAFALAIAGVIVGAVFLYLGRGLRPQESMGLDH